MLSFAITKESAYICKAVIIKDNNPNLYTVNRIVKTRRIFIILVALIAGYLLALRWQKTKKELWYRKVIKQEVSAFSEIVKKNGQQADSILDAINKERAANNLLPYTIKVKGSYNQQGEFEYLPRELYFFTDVSYYGAFRYSDIHPGFGDGLLFTLHGGHCIDVRFFYIGSQVELYYKGYYYSHFELVKWE